MKAKGKRKESQSISVRVNRIRKACGGSWTLAAALMKVSPSTVYSWENDLHKPLPVHMECRIIPAEDIIRRMRRGQENFMLKLLHRSPKERI